MNPSYKQVLLITEPLLMGGLARCTFLYPPPHPPHPTPRPATREHKNIMLHVLQARENTPRESLAARHFTLSRLLASLLWDGVFCSCYRLCGWKGPGK